MVWGDVQWLLSAEAGPLEPLARGREIRARHGGEEESPAVTVSWRFFTRLLSEGPKRDLRAHFISPQA